MMASASLTHPEWDKETGGLEVAKAFAGQIRGKKGIFHPPCPHTALIDT
jgi:hypothetical protein